MLFIITEHTTCNVCEEEMRGGGREVKMGKAAWSFHFFSFFLSFSFIARIIMSFLKRVMKSKKRSTQCLKQKNQMTNWHVPPSFIHSPQRGKAQKPHTHPMSEFHQHSTTKCNSDVRDPFQINKPMQHREKKN